MLLNKFGIRRILTPKQLSIEIGVPVDILLEFSKTAPKHYHPFLRKRDGKIRKIANPSKPMKAIQAKILRRLLNLVKLPDEIYGARKKRDIKQNASVHLRQRALVTIDIRDCFPSVSHKRIFRLFREEFKYSKEVASILTKLTTYRGSLPQGGVTSSMLLNILFIPLCSKIRSLTLPGNNKLTFWVDDIAFSGKKAFLLCEGVIRELQKFGFRTRSRKVKVMMSGHRQVLTGVVTNYKISVPKEKIEKYLKEARDPHAKQTTITGRLNFVKNINPIQMKRICKRLKVPQLI